MTLFSVHADVHTSNALSVELLQAVLLFNPIRAANLLCEDASTFGYNVIRLFGGLLHLRSVNIVQNWNTWAPDSFGFLIS